MRVRNHTYRGECMENEEMLRLFNSLASDLDALYHQAAWKLGVSDSVLIVLYVIYEHGGTCLLNTIRKDGNLNKQTLNSAIRKLEWEEILYLEQQGGRAKKVFLTEKGKEYAEQTAARLFYAERHVFKEWTEEEIRLHLELMKKYNDGFRAQIETW